MAYVHQLEKQALDGGIGASTKSSSDLSSTERTVQRLWKPHENGCDKCNHLGYIGRMGIYEVLENTMSIQKLIVTNTTSENVEIQAVKDGMVTMQMDGLIKALRGETSIEEIMRVTSTEG